jgi:2-oxoisovalerate dehydrogenase E1 component
MPIDRLQKLETRFVAAVRAMAGKEQEREVSRPWTPDLARGVLRAMIGARQVDLAAHELRAKGHGHYTICSTGHEINGLVGRLTTVADPAIVHYRSAAFQLERAAQANNANALHDILLSLVASSEDPTSGGRHKVLGGKTMGIIPSTSTIASHLPRAIGLAFAIERQNRLNRSELTDSRPISIASFGDASLNHSTALGAINTAAWGAYQNLPTPVLFVCEDNGLGISTRTPEGWVAQRLRAQPGLKVFTASAWELFEAYSTIEAAIHYVRSTRKPAALHLLCVRLLGHAGSDVDATYRMPAEIEGAIANDPLVSAAEAVVAAGLMRAEEILDLHQSLRAQVLAGCERAIATGRLTTRAAVSEALVSPHTPDDLAKLAQSRDVPAQAPALSLAQGINQGLCEILETQPGALIFGEDVGKKGGVYGVTKGLFARFGAHRVFNTLLDEQSILGIALGAATQGLLPIPEIQYLAYLHNAEDQLRGEAATMQFFSQRAYDNPMIVRIAGLAYQKGFGGHFHNDNSLAVLRDIPGIVVAVPARGDDALEILRTATRLALVARRVVVLIEPIALYHTKELEDGDSQWLAKDSGQEAKWLEPRVYGDGSDLCIITYGNGLWLSLRAAAKVERDRGVKIRVVDLRWLVPLPIDAMIDHARAVPRVLVVDECRQSGNVSEAILAALVDAKVSAQVRRINAADSLIPLGDAANLVLVSQAEIEAELLAMLRP